MASLIGRGERAFLPVVAVAALCSYIVIYAYDLNNPPIRADGYSYYVYLPAWFLYHDPSLERLADECCNGTYPSFSAITRRFGGGAWINPHPIGTAILIAPFFVIGHLLTLWSNLKPDGFSFYYQHAAGLAGVFYLVAGLALLRTFLKRHFPVGVTLAALVSITWGTNLFHYGTYDSVYSHVYSFFLFASFLQLTASWYDRPSLSGSLLLGAVAGLIFLTRHANALFLVYFPLYGVVGLTSLSARGQFLRTHGAKVAVMVVAAVVVGLPQLLLYKAATGAYFGNPYDNLMKIQRTQAFDFAHPKILEVLFGVRKGLFFWSPILAFSMAGFLALRGTARAMLLPSLVFLPVTVFLTASWWDWQFGGSYGHRAFTEGLAVLSVSMAASYQWAARRPRLAVGVTAVAAVAILLSVAQMIQYWVGIIPFLDMNWTQYRATFLRFSR